MPCKVKARIPCREGRQRQWAHSDKVSETDSSDLLSQQKGDLDN